METGNQARFRSASVLSKKAFLREMYTTLMRFGSGDYARFCKTFHVAIYMVSHFSCCKQKKNHCSHMIATLRESKTRLSELVNLANSGEEILITVHGQPKARILAVSEPRSDTADWLRELSALRSSLGQPSTGQQPSALDEVREDRW